MAKNCFDTAPFESLDSCPNDEVNGGVTTRVFYTPAAFLEKCILPPNTGELGKANTIEEANLALKQGSTWKGIDLQINENELKMSLVGNAGNKKAKIDFESKIPRFSDKVLDFIGRYKNVPMIFIVPDAVGTLWVVGTKINPAFMDSAEATTGKKAEDDAGVILKITANTKLYKYAGTITEG
jgi:hypothetical protein